MPQEEYTRGAMYGAAPEGTERRYRVGKRRRAERRIRAERPQRCEFEVLGSSEYDLGLDGLELGGKVVRGEVVMRMKTRLRGLGLSSGELE